MRLEDLPKYFSPKSPMFSDSPAATASDNLTITDVMASLGLATSKARMGIELFLAKHGINKPDEAVESLYQYALTQAHKYSAIQKLDEDDRASVLQILANYAFQDYARSAASKKACPDCDGGFIEAEVFTTKQSMHFAAKEILNFNRKLGVKVKPYEHVHYRDAREVKRVVCKTCNGKGEISHSCRCNGRGEVLDKKETEKQGIPVYKTCCKCSGRGYSRLPAEDVRREICAKVFDLPETSWRRNIKPFYEMLIQECFKEQGNAEKQLSIVTKRESVSIN
ncbi:antitermination protein [Providencia rettgeri]|uniref:Antitermination protein n=1 Tax=Providencia rettgeri TaxID=587 RepID=A0AAP2NVR4_PRORE|nr:antitermination protein [Providencia rettgeri]MBX6950213.1 antitermination protein [Providencia rettgeri]MBX6954718.1 antitermination protein [Providencia rettgeri]MBX6959201.1 antitermination protein [Providencia rettgeri]MBX6972122.1 antitermination protein [Providencia rettgeri]MBX6980433.1 antitermination protein [Providencia rettgeri]